MYLYALKHGMCQPHTSTPAQTFFTSKQGNELRRQSRGPPEHCECQVTEIRQSHEHEAQVIYTISAWNELTPKWSQQITNVPFSDRTFM